MDLELVGGEVFERGHGLSFLCDPDRVANRAHPFAFGQHKNARTWSPGAVANTQLFYHAATAASAL